MPFIVMPVSVARLDMGNEDIIHYGAIRVRVNGSGNLIPTFTSLDNVRSQVLVPLAINSTTDIEPLRLANFVTQRAFLRLETQQINEIFKINRVVIFVKPIFSMQPG